MRESMCPLPSVVRIRDESLICLSGRQSGRTSGRGTNLGRGERALWPAGSAPSLGSTGLLTPPGVKRRGRRPVASRARALMPLSFCRRFCVLFVRP